MKAGDRPAITSASNAWLGARRTISAPPSTARGENIYQANTKCAFNCTKADILLRMPDAFVQSNIIFCCSRNGAASLASAFVDFERIRKCITSSQSSPPHIIIVNIFPFLPAGRRGNRFFFLSGKSHPVNIVKSCEKP